MKTSTLQNIVCLSLTGLIMAATLHAADATAAAKPDSTASVPANPFGPKPAATGSQPGQATGALMMPPPPGARGGTPYAYVAAVRVILLERFDVNKDGTLDAAEQATAREVLTGQRGRGARGAAPAQAEQAVNGPWFGLRGPIMKHFGKMPNDSLDEAEVAQLRTFLLGVNAGEPKADTNLAALRQDILKQFDQDGDGKLDETELANAKMVLQQMLAELEKKSPAKTPGLERNVPVPANKANPPAASAKSAE